MHSTLIKVFVHMVGNIGGKRETGAGQVTTVRRKGAGTDPRETVCELV